MELKDAFKELARFAEARARGAVIEMSYPEPGKTLVVGVDEGTGIDARHFLKGYRIERIIDESIESPVFRNWGCADAKKHIGFAFRYRNSAEVSCITRHHLGNSEHFDSCEYATPIPGTDPAKWDWKPCKVEVPVEAPKANSVAVASIRNALTAMATCQDWRPTMVERARPSPWYSSLRTWRFRE